MAVTLLGYLENLILYQFGAYACFDLKTRMPWIQIAGAGMCALLAAVSELLMPVNVSEETVLASGSALGIDFRNGDGFLRGSFPAIISGNACPAVHFGASPLCS